jgi:hypothetical protein
MEFDKDIRMKEEQRKDLLRQAEQYRLAKQALAGRPPKDSFWLRLFHWLGHQLIDIGCFVLRQFDRQVRSLNDSPKLYPCKEGT